MEWTLTNEMGENTDKFFYPFCTILYHAVLVFWGFQNKIAQSVMPRTQYVFSQVWSLGVWDQAINHQGWFS